LEQDVERISDMDIDPDRIEVWPTKLIYFF
jgi:hypothetical protein